MSHEKRAARIAWYVAEAPCRGRGASRRRTHHHEDQVPVERARAAVHGDEREDELERDHLGDRREANRTGPWSSGPHSHA